MRPQRVVTKAIGLDCESTAARAQMRGLIGLDVMHGRVHVNDFDLVLVPYDVHERFERTINGLDLGSFDLKRLPLLDLVNVDHDVSESSVCGDLEWLQNPPAVSI